MKSGGGPPGGPPLSGRVFLLLLQARIRFFQKNQRAAPPSFRAFRGGDFAFP
jgi:hypothetical protein